MIVVARKFLPPGEGVFYRKSTEMDERLSPKDADEAVERSIKAMRFFWPALKGVAMRARLSRQMPFGWHVEGDGWSVTWMLKGYAEAMARIIDNPSEQEIEGFINATKEYA